jgi:hypothetical protein
MLMPPPAAVPPKPCNNRTTQRRVTLSATEDEHSRTQGRKECDNDTYDKLLETSNFHVGDGYVSFT